MPFVLLTNVWCDFLLLISKNDEKTVPGMNRDAHLS